MLAPSITFECLSGVLSMHVRSVLNASTQLVTQRQTIIKNRDLILACIEGVSNIQAMVLNPPLVVGPHSGSTQIASRLGQQDTHRGIHWGLHRGSLVA